MVKNSNLVATLSMVTTTTSFTIVKAWNPIDPVGSFLHDLAENLRNWYASFIEMIVNTISLIAVPNPMLVQTDLFKFMIGGTLGLTRLIFSVIAVVLTLVILMTPTLRHGVRLGRLVSSMIAVLLFGYLFYPIYGLLFSVSKGLTEGAIALATDDNTSIAEAILHLFDTSNIASIFNTIIATGISGVFGVFIIGQCIGIVISFLLVLILYPLFIAARPLGEGPNKAFHAANAVIFTTLFAPPVMGFAFVLPALVQKYTAFVAIVAAPFFALVGSVLAVVTPILCFLFAYKRSSRVFGSLDDLSGKFDIGRMPSVSVDDVKNDIKVTSHSSTTAVFADVIGDSMLYGNGVGDLFDDVIKTASNVAATTAASTGHPVIGMAVKGAAGAYDRMRSGSKSNTQGGGETDA